MSFQMEGYVDVAERIRQFRAKHPEGSLQPFNPAEPFRICEIGGREFIVYVAVARRHPDDQHPGIAVAAEPAVGKTNYTRDSELMNAETSAWGRAIIAALAADTQKVASLNEVVNRQADQSAEHPSRSQSEPRKQAAPRRETSQPASGGGISGKQIYLINKIAGERGISADVVGCCAQLAEREISSLEELTKQEASKAITWLMSLPSAEPEAPEEAF